MTLRSKSSFLIKFLNLTPPAAISAACPIVCKVFSLRSLASHVTAHELLKGTGLADSDAFALLSKQLQPSKLLGLVGGSGIKLQVVMDLFNVFTSVRAPGSIASSLDVLGYDMGCLRALTEFTATLLASLGMSALIFTDFAVEAARLDSMLPPHAKHIARRVLF